MNGNQNNIPIKNETIPIDVGASFGLEVIDRIKQQTFVPVDKNNLKKLNQEYFKYISKNHRFLKNVLPDICLGFSTTFVGAIVSAAIGGVRFPNLLAYFCYCVFPPLAVAFLFAFIIIKIIFNVGNDDFIRVTKEYILDQTGFGQSGEQNE